MSSGENIEVAALRAQVAELSTRVALLEMTALQPAIEAPGGVYMPGPTPPMLGGGSSSDKGYFRLYKTASGLWHVAPGRVYCGLTAVFVDETNLGENLPSDIYLNVRYAGGTFTAAVSSAGDSGALASILLYKCDEDKVLEDSRNVITLPLYN